MIKMRDISLPEPVWAMRFQWLAAGCSPEEMCFQGVRPSCAGPFEVKRATWADAEKAIPPCSMRLRLTAPMTAVQPLLLETKFDPLLWF